MVSESSLRRAAKRVGYRLCKSRHRTLHANNLGGWMIVHVFSNSVAAGSNFELSDEDVRAFLAEEDDE